MKTKKMLGAVAAVTMAIVMMLAVATPKTVYAASNTTTKTVAASQTTKTTSAKTTSSNPYSDVSKATVGKTALESIEYIKNHGGYRWLTSKKFKPSKSMTRREFVMTLGDLYGADVVPLGYNDIKNANAAVTDKWAKAKMVDVADKLGVELIWGNRTKKKLSRASAANWIYTFCTYDEALAPKQ